MNIRHSTHTIFTVRTSSRCAARIVLSECLQAGCGEDTEFFALFLVVPNSAPNGYPRLLPKGWLHEQVQRQQAAWVTPHRPIGRWGPPSPRQFCRRSGGWPASSSILPNCICPLHLPIITCLVLCSLFSNPRVHWREEPRLSVLERGLCSCKSPCGGPPPPLRTLSSATILSREGGHSLWQPFWPFWQPHSSLLA